MLGLKLVRLAHTVLVSSAFEPVWMIKWAQVPSGEKVKISSLIAGRLNCAFDLLFTTHCLLDMLAVAKELIRSLGHVA